jgi:hypothetical protein
MPQDYPHFPRRDQVRDYIASFATTRGHHQRISFNTEVLSVTPIDGRGAVGCAGWTVTTSTGAGTYDGVLVANGHLWDPKIPDVPGHFTGKQIHSGVYRNTDDIQGRRVLVVGAGNSGCDLAVDVAQHRLDVDIVVRHGSYFQPKMYFGRPRQEVPFLAEFSPAEQDLIARLMARVSIGENADYPGLPVPPHRTLADGATVVNDLLLYWIHHGRITVKGHGVERFDGNTVHFADGTAKDYDTILWATGFHATLPFLDDQLVTRRNGRPLRYAGGIVPAGLEKLYYIGLTAPRGPQIPIYGVQTKIAERMMRLHQDAGSHGAGIATYFARLQQPDDRIDIPRDIWLEQIADTNRLLDALEAATEDRLLNAAN